MVQFELKKEHVILMSNLNFKTYTDTEYGDDFIPTIDRKRPFGNSGTLRSVLEVLGYDCDKEGEYKEEDIDKAEKLLIELPVALEVVMINKTFQPDIYEIDKYSSCYNNYLHVKNYHALKAPMREVRDTCVETTHDAENMEKLQVICLNVCGDDPYKVIETLEWFDQSEFLKNAIAIFKKHRETG